MRWRTPRLRRAVADLIGHYGAKTVVPRAKVVAAFKIRTGMRINYQGYVEANVPFLTN